MIENQKEEEQAETKEQTENEKPDSKEPTQDRNWEAEARSMGWRPEKDFRGPKEKWVDAENFVKTGEEQLPVLRERLRHTSDELREVRKLLIEMKDSQKLQEDRVVKAAIADLVQKRDAAILESDIKKVNEIDKTIDDLKAVPVRPQEQAEIPREVLAWAEKNPWIRTNKPMANYAAAVYEQHLNNGWTEDERLAQVSYEVEKRFPEHFKNPRSAPSLVESGSGPKRTKGERGFSELPREAQEMADRLVKQKIYKNRDEYVKAYRW